ncbi:uncharacterized protein RJT20DRAFT_156225 [Scheffersomyces xylosifermentans]|uniref:uncharacterized protein n=1 Tax=Scheffersomyces xylosifermentans TaxID=1304137 RepID=UPI00315CDAD2
MNDLRNETFASSTNLASSEFENTHDITIDSPVQQYNDQTMMSPRATIPSSPFRSSPSIPGERHHSVLEDLHEKQQERSIRRLQPLASSSPIRRGGPDLSSSPTSGSKRNKYYHHHQIDEIEANGRNLALNMRNKHNKLRQVRNQYKQDKIMVQRSRINDMQFKEDFKQKYEFEYDEMLAGLDLDQLIEEEREIDEIDRNNEYSVYEQELLEMERQEEMEIAEMLESMKLS